MIRALLAAILLVPLSVSALGGVLVHQGRLHDASDTPVSGDVEMSFKLWSAPTPESTGGNRSKWESKLTVKVTAGTYTVALGDAENGGVAFPSDAFEGERWFSVTLGSNELLPRLRVGTSPSAEFARRAASADVAIDVACATPPCVQANEVADLPGSKIQAGTLAWAALASLGDAPAAIAGLEKTHNHDDKYYLKSQFAAAGDAQIHWDRLTGTRLGPGLTLGSDKTLDVAPNYLKLDGSTPMSGALQLGGAPTDPLHAATKAYVDGAVASLATGLSTGLAAAVKADGSVPMVGALQLPAALPISSTHAVSKGYADSTLLGVRPSSILRVRGSGGNCTAGCDRDIVLNGADQAGNARGVHVTVINRTTHAIVDNKTFDTHDASPAASTAGSDALTTYLNGLTSDVFVAVATYDAWTLNLTPAARRALTRVGASGYALTIPSSCCDDTTGGRTAYALVGIPGQGMGSGLERSNPSGIAQAELDVILAGKAILGDGDAPQAPQFFAAYGNAASSSGTSWTDIPGTLAFMLGRRATTKIEYTLSFSASTAGNHCGIRFVVDEVARGDATYGNAIQMGDGTAWWQSPADAIVENLAAGPHTVRLQIRGTGGGGCGLDAADYSRPWITATAYPY